MKITVESYKPLFGKKTKYVASFGQFNEEGATKEEAKEKLITALNWYFNEFSYPQNLNVDVIPEAGVTLLLNRTYEGYEIRTVHHDGRPNRGSSHYGRISLTEALERLKSHAAGYGTVNTN